MTIQYSKEVMKNFMNPKNLGEIKDADGIGKVGNPTCLLPDEKIFFNNTFKAIKEADKGDSIFSHDGTTNKVLAKFTREYQGEVITLKNAMGKISLTPEHLVYAINVPNQDKFKRNVRKRKLIPSWYHTRDLKKGDIILFPFSTEEKDISEIGLELNKLKYDFKSKEIPKKILLNSKFLRLIGYFLSEGNIQDKKSKTYISFALNIKEKDIVEDIQKIVKNLFGLEVKIKERPATQGVIVYLYHAQLARFFKKLFDNRAQNKYLPEFIMSLPINKQIALIEGLWKGDGYVNLNRIGPRAGYATISYNLAQQLKILLLRQGIVSSIYTEKEKESKGVYHRIAYRLHVGQRESLIKLCKILHLEYYSSSYQSISSWFDKGILYTPITKIEKKDYHGKVYNLEVENTHSFMSEAFCLHNCGDIMHVYIKVNKTKDKKEIIKDIKFQTFGCAAAIATSSMITQLAKGKLLEEAENIKYEDVMKELGGLPKVKIHCSMMAQEALNKAIKNYRERKNGK